MGFKRNGPLPSKHFVHFKPNRDSNIQLALPPLLLLLLPLIPLLLVLVLLHEDVWDMRRQQAPIRKSGGPYIELLRA
ncbi:Layilin, partial [Frankliniella fusca]